MDCNFARLCRRSLSDCSNFDMINRFFVVFILNFFIRGDNIASINKFGLQYYQRNRVYLFRGTNVLSYSEKAEIYGSFENFRVTDIKLHYTI